MEITILAKALLQLVCTGIFVAVGIASMGVVLWAFMQRKER